MGRIVSRRNQGHDASREGRAKRIICGGIIVGIGLLLLTSCSDIGYLAQCATGHLGVMNSCKPIDELIADPVTSPELKSRLQRVLEIRDFASSELSLPDNQSYRSYGDLGRPYVVWNVVATPEFSLKPVEWCFPVAGCVSYRGYYDRSAAERFAENLSRSGHDVHLYGVPAYSTLNWFDDPVLNTFLSRPEPNLAGTIFHELAHQVLYVKGDSRFNEAFATTVEIEGVKRWLGRSGDPDALKEYLERFRRHDAFLALTAEIRRELSDLYGSDLSAPQMRREKEAIFARARQRHEKFSKEWGYGGYDGFFAELSNARLASVSTYRDLVPAFNALLASVDYDLPAFFSAVTEISRLSLAERHDRLNAVIRLAEVAADRTENPLQVQ